MKSDNMTQVAEYWNKVAPDFDKIYSGDKGPVSRAMDKWLRADIYERLRWVMEASGDMRGKRVCDVGCGTGRFLVGSPLNLCGWVRWRLGTPRTIVPEPEQEQDRVGCHGYQYPEGDARAKWQAHENRRPDGACNPNHNPLLPEIERLQAEGKRVTFRADASFAKPEIYEALEKRGVDYVIRIPANKNLELEIEDILFRPPGRPSAKPLVRYKSFHYQAESWSKPRRIVAKVEHHLGELFPRVGFL